jgi:type IV secretory pathway protease TraF
LEAMRRLLNNKRFLLVIRYLFIVVVLSVEAYVLYHLRVPILTRSISPYVLWHQNDPKHRIKIVTGEYVTFDQNAPMPTAGVWTLLKRVVSSHGVTDDKTDERHLIKVTLIKRVGCNSGETITVDSNDDYYCNRTFLAHCKREVAGKPITPFRFNGQIPADKLFAIGDYSGSFDSRVYGFVDRDRIKGVAWPLL